VGDELGGHIVTGHVDAVATVTGAEEVGGSLDVTIEAPRTLGSAIAPKGSIALDGVSLTVNEVMDVGEATSFTVNLIPHTADHTTLGAIAVGSKLNLEIDVLARYLKRMADARV
jgi:riboflavin synthase